MQTLNAEGPKRTEILAKRAATGGIWVFTLRVSTRALGLVKTMVLARLLEPSDFGLMGIAMLAIASLEAFSQTGFQAALIQKKEKVEEYLNTAWTVSIIRGILLFLILFFSAPIIAGFFSSSQAVMVIRIIAISTLLMGFRNIGVLFFQKDLEFKKFFIYELLGNLAELIAAISIGLAFRSVWALVYGYLGAEFVKLLLSFLLHSHRPQIRFEREKVFELFGFGKWIFFSTIMAFLLSQGDDAFIGKLLGVTALGFYQVAYNITSLPATEIAKVFSIVTFPVYSKLQSNKLELNYAFSTTFQLVCILSFLLASLIFSLSYEMTVVILGNKWLPIVPVVKVFALGGLIRALGSTLSPVFQAVGKPEIISQVQVIILATLIAVIYPLTLTYGIVGAAFASTGAALLPNIWFFHVFHKTFHYARRQIIREICYPAVSAILTCLSITKIRPLFVNCNMTLTLLFLGLVGCIIYFLVICSFTKFTSYDAMGLIKRLKKAIK